MKNIDLLESFINWVSIKKNRGHKIFDFRVFNYWDSYSDINSNSCGTSGCLAGELPVFDPINWEFDKELIKLKSHNKPGDFLGIHLESHLMSYFDLTLYQIEHLFFPEHQQCDLFGGKKLYEDSTLEEVLNNAQIFTNQYKKKLNG
jgi:hypothetical protein